REHTRREHAVRVGEDGTTADRAGRRVDDIVDEIHVALVREVLVVDQLERDVDARAAAAAGDVVAVRRHALVAQIRRLVEGELEVDRILRDDGGEQRGVAGGAAGNTTL